MFGLFTANAEFWLAALLVVLLVGPPILYLLGPWTFRRHEILDGMSAPAIETYFETFHPKVSNKTPASFSRFYAERFGRRHYVIPLVVLTLAGVTAIVWLVSTMLVWTGLRQPTSGTLDHISAAALSGAYLWVAADLIERWRFRDLSPADLWWGAWRLALAAPLAFAVSAMFTTQLAVPIAFLLGAFPTRSISTIARRLGRRALNLGADTDEKAESELEKLQGIDTRIAERFADEGFTTIVQLAYADPVELTMRCASFAFSFVLDCASQALAWEYLMDDLIKLRPYSLRGAQEISSLITELDGHNPVEKKTAHDTIAAAAKAIGIDPVAFERTLREIQEDPYTDFICKVWLE